MSGQIQCPLILASASPRRRKLLAEAGYEFVVDPPDIDESAFEADGISPCEYASRLALAKAKSTAEKHPHCLVIGADTVVDCNGEIIGKAADAKQAEKITKKLFNKAHKVITAVAVVRLSDGTEVVESDATTIYPKKLTDKQIAGHVKGRAWQDKAGAYAIKETGDKFIEKINGSLTNVMGLPMELVQRLLKRFMR